MNEMEKNKIARNYLAAGNDQVALDGYKEVYDANNDNAEAAYFVYTALWETDTSDLTEKMQYRKTAYVAMSSTLADAIAAVAASDDEESVKALVIGRFVGLYTVAADYAVKYLRNIDPAKRIKMAVLTLHAAGDIIEREMGANETAMIAACMAWKAGVKLQQQFYAYKYEGYNVEDYVAKIKKTQPDYVMPKKAGCISKP